MEISTMFLMVFFPSFLLFILGLIYLNKKYPEKTTKLDPLIKGLVIGACLFSLLAVSAGVGIIEKEIVEKSLPYIIIITALFIAYFVIKDHYKNKPIKFERRYQIVMDNIKQFYRGSTYVGKAYDITLRYHSVYEGNIPTTGDEDIREMITGVVDAFLISVKREVFYMVLIIINVYTGENVKMVVNPSYDLTEELIGKKAVSVYKQWEKEQKEKNGEGEE